MTNLAPSSTPTPQAPMSLLADSAFRARLEQDPVAAFAAVGITVQAPEKIILPDLEDLDDRQQTWRGLLG